MEYKLVVKDCNSLYIIYLTKLYKVTCSTTYWRILVTSELQKPLKIRKTAP